MGWNTQIFKREKLIEHIQTPKIAARPHLSSHLTGQIKHEGKLYFFALLEVEVRLIMCVSEWHPAAATILANLCFLCASNAAIDQYVSVLISFAKMHCSNQQNLNCKIFFHLSKEGSVCT